jgi:TRAP-type C4-dicarboxylate transport system permease small subunit
MSTWRALPARRRVALVLAALCVVALGVQMYSIADRTTDTSPTVDLDDYTVADGRADAPVNEFIPVDRDISECISAIPKPGCGSKARGGWHQTLVLLAILAGLALITWRIVVAARKAKAAQDRRVAAGH